MIEDMYESSSTLRTLAGTVAAAHALALRSRAGGQSGIRIAEGEGDVHCGVVEAAKKAPHTTRVFPNTYWFHLLTKRLLAGFPCQGSGDSTRHASAVRAFSNSGTEPTSGTCQRLGLGHRRSAIVHAPQMESTRPRETARAVPDATTPSP